MLAMLGWLGLGSILERLHVFLTATYSYVHFIDVFSPLIWHDLTPFVILLLMMLSLISCHPLSISNKQTFRCVVDPSNLHPPTELNQRAVPPCARCGTPKCHRGFAKGLQPCLCWLSWAELRCQEVRANSPVGWWCWPAVILQEWLCLGRWFFKERLGCFKNQIGKMQYVIFVVLWQRSSERMQSVLAILCWHVHTHVHMPYAIRNGDTYCLCTCVFKMYIYTNMRCPTMRFH